MQNEQNTLYLALVATAEEVFVVWLPCDYICESWTQLRIFFIAGYLPSFETETGIDAKTLVIDIPARA